MLFSIFAFLILLNPTAWSLPTHEIVLSIGGTQKMSPPVGATIRNSNKNVIKLSENGSSLNIVGKSSGTAEIVINHTEYRVHVLRSRPYLTYKKLAAEIKNMRGLSVSVSEGKPIITGRLLRLSDWRTLAETVDIENAEYTFAAEVDHDIRSAAFQWIETLLKENLLPSPQILLSPHPKILISRELLPNRSGYIAATRAYGLPIILSQSALSLEPVVAVEILVTELRRKHFQRLGVKYPSSYEAQLLPKTAFEKALHVSLEAIEENGWGRVLASPRLICRSGKEAQFIAGGEIPVRTTGFQSGAVTWKKYGVQLNVKPKADRSGRMSLELTTEVSSIDASQVVDGIPGLLMNRIQTHFDLQHSQTIALSGLIKNESGRSTEGLPWLQKVPILGLLFSSQEYRNHETELVIFVTPKVLDPSDMPMAESNQFNGQGTGNRDQFL